MINSELLPILIVSPALTVVGMWRESKFEDATKKWYLFDKGDKVCVCGFNRGIK